MAALLDAVGAGSAIVGGLSLGGYMSLAFYRAHPERVRALLIIDTGPGFKKDDAREAWNERAHRDRRPFRARRPCGSEVGQPRTLQRHAIAMPRAWRAPRAAC